MIIRRITLSLASLVLAFCSPLLHAQQAPVIAKKVTKMSMPMQAESLGTTMANESVNITSKVSERVSRIRFEEGQLVKAGQELVELDTDEARANLAVASADFSESRSNFKRAEELDRTKSISQSELKQLQSAMEADQARVQAATARLADLTIRAPFDGRVGLRRISAGSLVSPGTIITTLDDLDTIKLDFSLPEVLMAKLKPGLEINATSIAYPDTAFAGKVISIDTRVDPVTRSITIRARIPNAEGLLRPGMLMSVVLIQEELDALVIPEQSLISEQSRQYVFVINQGRAEKRQVETGRRRPGEVEIVDGLVEGEMIVVEGTQRLQVGSEVEVIKELAADETQP
jgi:membrane fusion protein (multidrug efflux system)